ncbi:MAG: hypothetical protein PHD06_10845 [Bacteroidales bacterium]|nr:hypothetical protein [Bacteroidales bacterium]
MVLVVARRVHIQGMFSYILRGIKWFAILLISAYALSSNLFCQQSLRRFSEDVLANPIDNAQWFDTNIEIDSVPIYKFIESGRSIIFDFGYANATFQNDTQAFIDVMAFRQPVMVDVIFTGYPIKKDDWITNYYTLLANRVASLVEFDNRMNDREIEWRLIIQTSCTTDKDAKLMFHGAVVSTKNMVPNRLAALYAKRVIFDFLPYYNVDTNCSKVSIADEVPANLAEIESILYPKSIYDRGMRTYLPKGKNRGKEPNCPKFRTRMQKPRRSIWSRIFR